MMLKNLCFRFMLTLVVFNSFVSSRRRRANPDDVVIDMGDLEGNLTGSGAGENHETAAENSNQLSSLTIKMMTGVVLEEFNSETLSTTTVYGLLKKFCFLEPTDNSTSNASDNVKFFVPSDPDFDISTNPKGELYAIVNGEKLEAPLREIIRSKADKDKSIDKKPLSMLGRVLLDNSDDSSTKSNVELFFMNYDDPAKAVAAFVLYTYPATVKPVINKCTKSAEKRQAVQNTLDTQADQRLGQTIGYAHDTRVMVVAAIVTAVVAGKSDKTSEVLKVDGATYLFTLIFGSIAMALMPFCTCRKGREVNGMEMRAGSDQTLCEMSVNWEDTCCDVGKSSIWQSLHWRIQVALKLPFMPHVMVFIFTCYIFYFPVLMADSNIVPKTSALWTCTLVDFVLRLVYGVAPSFDGNRYTEKLVESSTEHREDLELARDVLNIENGTDRDSDDEFVDDFGGDSTYGAERVSKLYAKRMFQANRLLRTDEFIDRETAADELLGRRLRRRSWREIVRRKQEAARTLQRIGRGSLARKQLAARNAGGHAAV